MISGCKMKAEIKAIGKFWNWEIGKSVKEVK